MRFVPIKTDDRRAPDLQALHRVRERADDGAENLCDQSDSRVPVRAAGIVFAKKPDPVEGSDPRGTRERGRKPHPEDAGIWLRCCGARWKRIWSFRSSADER